MYLAVFLTDFSECGEGVESIFMAQRLHVVSKHLLLDPTLPVDANDENFRECMDSCFPGAIPRDDLGFVF